MKKTILTAVLLLIGANVFASAGKSPGTMPNVLLKSGLSSGAGWNGKYPPGDPRWNDPYGLKGVQVQPSAPGTSAQMPTSVAGIPALSPEVLKAISISQQTSVPKPYNSQPQQIISVK